MAVHLAVLGEITAPTLHAHTTHVHIAVEASAALRDDQTNLVAGIYASARDTMLPVSCAREPHYERGGR